MMKREGCGPGKMQWGRACVAKELPHIGSNLVPSVENPAGCEHIHGHWDKKHNVCIWSLHPHGGWTAPIKGIYFSWMHGPGVSLKYAESPKDLPHEKWDDWFKKLPKMAEIKACHVYGDPFYGSIGDGVGGGGFCVHWLIEKTIYNSKGAREALSMAKKVMDGKGHELGLGYFTKEGKPTSPRAREAVASDTPDIVRDIYSRLNLERQPPFSIRAGLERKR